MNDVTHNTSARHEPEAEQEFIFAQVVFEVSRAARYAALAASSAQAKCLANAGDHDQQEQQLPGAQIES